MLSILETTNSEKIGGMLGRTITTVAIPVPGAGVVLAPVGSAVGEAIGKMSPSVRKNQIPEFAKDSVEVYGAGKKKNTSLSLSNQIELRKQYIKKAEELRYNKVGQTVAAIDPGLLSLAPNILTKQEVKNK